MLSSSTPVTSRHENGLADTTVFLGFALFAFIFLARTALIANAGNDIPFFDQWDGEAKALYQAWETGTWTWGDLFRPHNEHRLFATHALNVLLLSLNGQWDPLVQMLVGAVISGGTAAALVVWLTRGIPGFQKAVVALVIAVLFLPIASWHNALWGFQSQVFFTLGFSVIAMWGWTDGSHRKARLVVALLATVLAVVSSGTAVFLGAALIGGAIESALSRRRLETCTRYVLIGGLFVIAQLGSSGLQYLATRSCGLQIGRIL